MDNFIQFLKYFHQQDKSAFMDISEQSDLANNLHHNLDMHPSIYNGIIFVVNIPNQTRKIVQCAQNCGQKHVTFIITAIK